MSKEAKKLDDDDDDLGAPKVVFVCKLCMSSDNRLSPDKIGPLFLVSG